ncbi:Poly [ADP-ribose] polymerase 12-like Protein [Tribolium castaneum]|uniref:Poly [ADP-ribose] polymerase n=1 Tax=Tribolium castaneum TaxID=7070 RepID=D6WSN8_TRICA|nr:PREDICTED: poly [ADP-ribose] polymerase 11 [Tribolium castaneum]XP_970978.1 PREDICTED: poly [ADP-ribose] polymerase 11 [Tribolium castaneum]EFA07133.1 Poly [ADP-ribose] polymerase 12-like Protein [Tribolium castaneum]|eukprot:XP_015837627.1 PREDICTED: poly [ADP-ribose] polymerase 11 [Tribolium castaneum]
MSLQPSNSLCEKSEENSALLEKILGDPMTKYWLSNNHNPYALNIVHENSDEYNYVQQLFERTAGNLMISKLERVENPYLVGCYLLKKKQMWDKCGHLVEKTLFHGTRNAFVDSICKFNFDWRRSGTSKGTVFGKGVYFTSDVSYAHEYTFGDNVMFLAKVLVGDRVKGKASYEVLPEPFDTATNDKETIFVKFEDNEFYPQYVIQYR